MTDHLNETYTLSVGGSVRATDWQCEEWTLAKFIDKLANPRRTAETTAEYAAMDKSERSARKDVGGYVGGTLKGTRRAKGEVESRSLITLDLDEVTVPLEEALAQIERALPYFYIVHPTHSHTPNAPRLRIILPLARPVSPEEYTAIARGLEADIGIEWFDPSTDQPERLMFWPSAPRDMDYDAAFVVHEGPLVVGAEVLARYDDWRDARQWPHAAHQPALPRADEGDAESLQDPREKPGLVGAFCRAYSVPEAIAAFLPEVYTPGDAPDRYTYAAGTTANGLVIYDDGLACYDNHSTSPASGKRLNAFDLVRLHKFGALDAHSRTKNPTKLPSYAAMVALVKDDARVKQAQASALFGDEEEGAEARDAVRALLAFDDRGRVENSIDNALIVLTGDPAFAGKLYKDSFAQREVVVGAMPWDAQEVAPDAVRDWIDSDSAGLRHYLEKNYGITSASKIEDALTNIFLRNERHPVRMYLNNLPPWDGVPRVERVFVDFLGAEDTPYIRTITTMHLVAAVHRVFHPGEKYDYILVLSGPQGIGKSQIVHGLCPDPKWCNDSLSDLSGKNKDVVQSLAGSWLIELPELAAVYRTELEPFKAFSTKNEDKLREPYARRHIHQPRQCIFIGTTNDVQFLRDPTGDRRTLPVACGVHSPTKDVHRDLPRERDQIWAEVMFYYHAGAPIVLSPEMERVAGEVRAAFTAEDVQKQLIDRFLDIPLPHNWKELSIPERQHHISSFDPDRPSPVKTRLRTSVTAIEVWVELFGRPISELQPKDSARIVNILNNLPGWKRVDKRVSLGKHYSGYRPTKHFVRECENRDEPKMAA